MSGNDQTAGCRFCDGKKGLAILPLRYAVARRGMGNAPEVSKPFDPLAQAGDQKSDMALKAGEPNDAAPFQQGGYYTTRLLRGGYLYVYDEKQDQWRGYVVTKDKYLYPFERGETPPDDVGDTEITCKREGCEDLHFLARFVYIKNGEDATRVWMTYSDVLWTETVWAQYDNADFRKKHMRCFDVAQWRNGSVDHADVLYRASTRVAEMVASSRELKRETHDCARKVLGKNWTVRQVQAYQQMASQGKEKDDQDRNVQAVLRTVPPLVRTLVDSRESETAAWAFSGEPLRALDAEPIASMQTTMALDGGSIKPAMLALDDPSGIAMDLNGLMLQHIGEATADPEYHWKHQTAASIRMLRQSVRMQGIEQEAQRRRNERRRKLTRDHGPMTNPANSDESRQRLEKMVAEAGELTPAEAQKAGDDAWEEYAARYNTDAVKAFLDGDGGDDPGEAQKHMQAALDPLKTLLDEPFVAWLKSDMLANYFRYHFDPADRASGEAYADLAHLILNEAAGRTDVATYLNEQVDADPNDPTAWVLRAAFGNQDTWIADAKAVASNDTDWDSLAESLKADLVEHVGDGKAVKVEKLTQQTARFSHGIAGAVTARINQGLDAGGDERTRLLVANLGAQAKLEQDKLTLVGIQGRWTDKQAGRALARMLGKGQQKGTPLNNRKVRKALDKVNAERGKQYAYSGIVLAAGGSDLAVAWSNQKLEDMTRIEKAGAFERGMEQSVSKLSKYHVRAAAAGGILAAVSVGFSYRDMINAKAGHAAEAGWNFTAGVSDLVGQISEQSGKAIRRSSMGVSKYATELGAYTGRAARAARFLELGGRILGAAGGVITAVLLTVKAFSVARDGNAALAYIYGAMALATAFSVILLFTSAAGVGVVIGVIVAIVVIAIDWLQDDAIQKWLNKCHHFGKHKDPGFFATASDYEAYDDPIAQSRALNAMMQGG